ncbi:MAG: hypothetical protein QNK23_18090 [Crocinitomicaceae bacterium]|nr:hypothetical protein [Crocinitomicaceae bacterium]
MIKLHTILLVLFTSAAMLSRAQTADSLLYGTWLWKRKGDKMIVLQRRNELKRNKEGLEIYLGDTMYRKILNPPSKILRSRYKFAHKKGHWYRSPDGLLILTYRNHTYSFKESYKLVTVNKKKITMRLVESINIELDE